MREFVGPHGHAVLTARSFNPLSVSTRCEQPEFVECSADISDESVEVDTTGAGLR